MSKRESHPGSTPYPQQSGSRVPRARWWRIGTLMFLMYTVAFADRQNISVALPSMVKDLGLSATLGGVLLSAFFWGYIATQLPGGIVAHRIGPKRIIVGALVLWGLMAMATGIVNTYHELLAVRALMGLAEGVIWPAFAAMFVSWYPAAERGRAISFTSMALPVSSIIMAPTAGWLIAAWNWHTMFIVQGLPPLVLAVLFAILGADHPDRDRYLSSAERAYLAEHASSSRTVDGRLIDIFRSPTIWVICCAYFCWITGLYSFGLWLPSLLKQLSARGIEAVGLLSAVPFVLAAAGMFANARWSDRSARSRTWFIAIPLVLAGTAILLQHLVRLSLFGNMVLLAIAALGLYSAFGPFWAWLLSFVPRNQAGAGTALVNLVGNFGGIVGPIVVGAAASGRKITDGFYILGFFLLAAAAIVAMLSMLTRKSTPDRVPAVATAGLLESIN